MSELIPFERSLDLFRSEALCFISFGFAVEPISLAVVVPPRVSERFTPPLLDMHFFVLVQSHVVAVLRLDFNQPRPCDISTTLLTVAERASILGVFHDVCGPEINHAASFQNCPPW